MKLRLHENTLRLRLSRKDVAQLAETATVEETVTFGGDRRLVYRLEAGTAPLAASFDGAKISVSVPYSEVKSWAATDQTGIEGSAGALRILIEKDFQCLHPGAVEDSAAFPNPARSPRNVEA